MGRSYNERRWSRHVKGMRRIRADRAEHGNTPPGWVQCDCFSDDATHGRGATFARFADTPQNCSTCCGNRRQWEGPTLQERRAVNDWA